MPVNRSYEDIVKYFQAACSNNVAVASFETGPIDYLDSSAVNRYYPFVFLRPMSSLGVQGNTKTLSFELYSLDVPKLSDGNALRVMSNTEEILYTIASYFTLGPDQKYYDLVINTITPVNEGFQDRVFGWVADIDVITPYTLNYCDYPTPVQTIPVYSQVVSFSPNPMNSIIYKCNGNPVAYSYGTNQTNLTNLVNMFNAVPKVQPNATFLEYGVSYDNGDGRVRMEMTREVYETLCPSGTLTLEVIYD